MGISNGLDGAVGALPPGVVMPYAGATEPAGWLLCAGQAVSRTTYGALFAAIGTTYGTGNGSTTFNLPDLRGRVVAGRDNMGGTAANRLTSGNSGIAGATLGAAGGDERLHQHQHVNTLTNNTVTSGLQSASHSHSGTTGNDSPDHSHTYTIPNWNANVAIASSSVLGTTQPYASSVNSGGRSAFHQHSFTTGNESANHSHSVTSNVTITNADAGTGASQNVQPTIVLNYIIKAVNY